MKGIDAVNPTVSAISCQRRHPHDECDQQPHCLKTGRVGRVLGCIHPQRRKRHHDEPSDGKWPGPGWESVQPHGIERMGCPVRENGARGRSGASCAGLRCLARPRAEHPPRAPVINATRSECGRISPAPRRTTSGSRWPQRGRNRRRSPGDRFMGCCNRSNRMQQPMKRECLCWRPPGGLFHRWPPMKHPSGPNRDPPAANATGPQSPWSYFAARRSHSSSGPTWRLGSRSGGGRRTGETDDEHAYDT